MSQMYHEHLNAFERAVQIRKDLEERVRQLEKLETAHIAHLQYEYAQREAKYQETIHLIQENYARFRKEVDKEVALKDIIIERGEQFNHVLKKELVVAQNIIRTPMMFNKA